MGGLNHEPPACCIYMVDKPSTAMAGFHFGLSTLVVLDDFRFLVDHSIVGSGRDWFRGRSSIGGTSILEGCFGQAVV